MEGGEELRGRLGGERLLLGHRHADAALDPEQELEPRQAVEPELAAEAAGEPDVGRAPSAQLRGHLAHDREQLGREGLAGLGHGAPL